MTDAQAQPGRIDWLSAAMALAASLAVAGTVWLRFGPEGPAEPPAIGAKSPPLRLLDKDTSEPLVLLGLRGRVVWVAFWTAGAQSELDGLRPVWNRLRDRRKFSMVAAAVGGPATPPVRERPGPPGSSLPVYLATPETSRAFGATSQFLPLHVLIDPQGRVGAVARGSGPETLARLSAQAERWLDEVEPPGDDARFAMRGDTVRTAPGRQAITVRPGPVRRAAPAMRRRPGGDARRGRRPC